MEIEKITAAIELSKWKNDMINVQTDEIYNKIIVKTYPKNEGETDDEYANRLARTKAFLDGVHLHIMRKKEAGIASIMERKLYEVGYQTRDPYMLGNFKAITPIIKKCFFDKGVTTQMLINSFDAVSTNDALRNEGAGYLSEYMQIIELYVEEFNKKLFVKNIDKKMRQPKLKGIPMGIIKDLLANMRSYSAKLKKQKSKE
jgi:hypothetical protein